MKKTILTLFTLNILIYLAPIVGVANATEYFKYEEKEICVYGIVPDPVTGSYARCYMDTVRVPYYGEIYPIDENDTEEVTNLEERVLELENQNQALANILSGEGDEKIDIFEGIEFNNICSYRPLDTILRLYEEHQDCEIFTYNEENHEDESSEYIERNTCRAHEQCIGIENDIEDYPNSAIIEGFKLYQYCENHTTPMRNARCNMLRPTITEPVITEPVSTAMIEENTTQTVAINNIQHNTLNTSTNFILDQITKDKIQKVKLLLDAKGYSKDKVVPLVQNIKTNLESGTKKYAIADYLISLY